MTEKILNDRQLIEKIQTHKKSQDYEILYKRYMLMINKYAFKVGKNLVGRSFDIQQDFKQEAYFIMVKAVNNIHIDNIQNDNWKFQNVFYFYLRKLQHTFLKNIFTYDSLHLSTQKFEEQIPSLKTNDFVRSKIPQRLQVSMNHYSEFNDVRDIIMAQFTDRQKEIVKYRQLNMTLSEIGKELNISHPAVHWDLKRAKKIAENLIEKLVY